jgi:hypothetical protein
MIGGAKCMLENQLLKGCLVLALVLLDGAWSLAQPTSNAPLSAAGGGIDGSSGPASAGSDISGRTNSRSTRSNARDSYVRLARAPNMFGDSLRPVGNLEVRNTNFGTQESIPMPLAGGSSSNIAENNSALPTDRAYFIYNGFYNAISNPNGGASSLQMYTVGFEKTFFNRLWSVDLRMPFNSGFDFRGQFVSTDSGNVGNLTVFLKGLLYQDDDRAIASGLGIGLPTGSDVVTATNFQRLTLQNEAVHLMPFIAYLGTPTENVFIQAFTQINFAASGNPVTSTQGAMGTFTEQNVFHADIAVGRWLLRDIGNPYLHGIAGILELHYASTLQNADTVDVSNGGVGDEITIPQNRVDLLNMTTGLHFQLTEFSNLRFGVVAPLRAAPDRVFDSELQVTFNRLF